MYKSRLQQLCHQREWALPEYASSREGPEHKPHFMASVTVNGVTFLSADFSKSSKEAQNKAAQAAVEHFAAAVPPPPPPRASSAENQMSYKSQLQNFTQKKNFDLPIYTCIREGLPHAPRFKATVTVDGKTFESSQYFCTLKEAEHDAAKVALASFPPEENQQGETGLYKNLLQELAQKEGFSLPKYATVRGGASHMPIFSSTVEVGGQCFKGEIAKNRKQAEINAAKVAWCKLDERRLRKLTSGLPSSCQRQKEPACVVSRSESAVFMNLLKPRDVSVPASLVNIDKEAEVVRGTECPSEEGTRSLLCNRVRVYPCKPDLVLPEGTTLLPFCDDMWVAVSLDFSNQEGGALL